MKILLTLPDKLTKDIDEVCDAQGYDRVEWIRMAIRGRLYDKDHMHDEHGIIREINTQVEKELNKPTKTGTIPAETSTLPIDKTKTISGRYDVTATTLPMWCQGHFEQGVTHTCYKISYEDENGVEVLKDKWFCEKCVRGYMNRVGKVYGHLE